MKKHWKRICGILLLAAVVGGCAWYSRPVDIYTLMPGLEPRYLYVTLTDFSSFADPKKYTLSLTEEGPEHTELRQTLEALRFRRIPLGRLWNWFDRQGGKISYSPYSGILGISDGVHYLTLNYQDDWEYIAIDKDSGRSAFYNVSLSGGEEATQALTDDLLRMAELQS